jgi:uncharacterized protein YukE
MPTLKEITEQVSIIPPEAHTIAAAFRNEARRVRDLASQNRSTKGTLDGTWQGNSKNKFSGNYDPQIGQLDNYANMLEEKAREIENIHVIVLKKKFVLV